MTTFAVGDPHSGTTADVYVWHCDGCHCTHVRAGSTLLTFTAAEFADFVQAVNRCDKEQGTATAVGDAPDETPEPIIYSTVTH